MMRALFFILCGTLFFTNHLFAQQSSGIKYKHVNNFPNYDSIQTSHIGKTYPPFTITTLDGKILTQDWLKGKVTWVNFWFENCPGCRNEFDKLNKLYDSLKNDPNFQFIAITFDNKETLPSFIKKYDLHFPIALIANEDIAQTMNYGNGFPTNMIIDKNGKVALLRWWLTERPAKYGILMDDAYKMISKLEKKPYQPHN